MAIADLVSDSFNEMERRNLTWAALARESGISVHRLRDLLERHEPDKRHEHRYLKLWLEYSHQQSDAGHPMPLITRLPDEPLIKERAIVPGVEFHDIRVEPGTKRIVVRIQLKEMQ